MKQIASFGPTVARGLILVLACCLIFQSASVRAQEDPQVEAAENAVEGEPVALEAAITPVFTYHGNLTISGSPANGTFDFEFRLFGAESGGNPIGNVVTRDNVPVAGGAFQTTVGFGAGAFNGQERWMEIRVRNGNSTGAYTTLTPRRPLLAVPYATYSANTRGITVNDNGNVGIGTPDPVAKLHVDGSIRTLNSVSVYNPAETSAAILLGWNDSQAVLRIGGPSSPSTTNGFNIQRADNVLFSVTSNAQVGIGIADPRAKLDVDGGAVRITNQGDGAVLLDLQSARSWQFRQRGTGSGTALELASVGGGGNKHFIVNTTGYVGIGTQSPKTTLDVNGTTTTKALRITGGADLAEPFAMTDEDAIEPGMVVTIDSENVGQLRLADQAYDRGVAGVVSGAGGINPGITLQQEGTEADGAHPVSLSGRVYVWADASYGAISPTDLLTTSDTPGHAMRVTDYERAQGAILGKAMSSLEEGTGLVLVLVSLQ